MSNKNRSQGPSSETIRKEAQAYREKWRIMEAREARLEQKRGLSQTKKTSPPLSRSLPRSMPSHSLSERQSMISSQPNPAPERMQPRGNDRPSRRRKRRVMTLRAKVIMGILALLLLFGLFQLLSSFGSRSTQEATPAPAVVTTSKKDTDTEALNASVISDGAILINGGNGDVVFGKNADKRYFPASLTKLMTMYVAIQQGVDLSKQVTLTPEVFDGLYESGASTSGLKQGETVSVGDLLYATLLPSGADASKALACSVAGDEESFVKLMNDTAASLKMNSSHFTNPTGLHDENQYTTCRDMARLLKVALGNSQFKKVFSSAEYTTSLTTLHPQGVTLRASYLQHMDEFKLSDKDKSYKVIGAKTGYTPEAAVCLASCAVSDHKEYIVVSLHAQGDGENYYPALKDAFQLYDYAFK